MLKKELKERLKSEINGNNKELILLGKHQLVKTLVRFKCAF